MAWILGELSWWNHRNTRCSCCGSSSAQRTKKFLKQQLQAEKAENDRFLEMDKLRKEIDFANLYLEKFISYYDEYGNLYEKAINKLDRLLFIKDEKHYLIENDFIQVSATAYELEKDYNQLMNTYNLLKTMITNLDISIETKKLSKDYLKPLEEYEFEEFKRKYRENLRIDLNEPEILFSYQLYLTDHYNKIVEHVKLLNDQYRSI
ncbi:hypothetical protein C7R28_00375 [Staphylococcus aureus]|uniref:hypothetical protein n=1 Tax=Staphylococcus aureus TaxID=1280 RepID=UPI000DA856E8|nr:hypothetical protein [Staphylococcus aureus]MCS4799568.1 hypothetical protein [Staphylococcus aureus]PZI19162.1 hypothetical protein C7R28_00375 [Staphylococcus aureus]